MSKNEEKYIGDPTLVSKIKLFLQSRDRGSSVHPDDVVQHLQSSYREYARKKRNALLHSVSRALPVAKREVFGSEGEGKTQTAAKRRRDSSSDSSPEGLVAYENHNLLNLALREAYKSQNASKASSPATPIHQTTPAQQTTPTSKKVKKKHKHPDQGQDVAGRDKTETNADQRQGDREEDKRQSSRNRGEGTNSAEAGNVQHQNWEVSFSCKTCGVTLSACMSIGSSLSVPCMCAGEKASWSMAPALSNTPAHRDRVKKAKTTVVKAAESETSGNAEPDSSGKKRPSKRKRARLEDTQTDFLDLEPITSVTSLEDFAGYEKLIQGLRKDLKLFNWDSLVPTKTCHKYLLHGPQGSGKGFLAECIAGHMRIPLLKPNVHELISGVSGESEKRVQDLFEEASALTPCVLYLEDIQTLVPAQDSHTDSKPMLDRIASMFGRCVDDLSKRKNAKRMVLIASTTEIGSVHKSLRSPGRFKEIGLGMPDEKARQALLQKMCDEYTASPHLSLKELGKLTPGFVAGDLQELVDNAQFLASCRVAERYNNTDAANSEGLHIPPAHLVDTGLTEADREALGLRMEDFMESLKTAQPAAKREGFPLVPETTWEDVGGLDHVREELNDHILDQIRHTDIIEKGYHVSPKAGVILVGPPGCGKTMVAKAMANEAGLNFMYINGPELFDKYVGESERKLREKFEKAQTCAPCLIFFDEMETMTADRRSTEGSGVRESMTNQLLGLMDGVMKRDKVYVMGATNIIEKVDPALLRPGRFNKQISIGLPTTERRLDILHKLTKNENPKLVDCDLGKAAQAAEGFSGADVRELWDEAQRISMKRVFRKAPEWTMDDVYVTGEDFSCASLKVKPSVRKKDAERYARLAEQN